MNPTLEGPRCERCEEVIDSGDWGMGEEPPQLCVNCARDKQDEQDERDYQKNL